MVKALVSGPTTKNPGTHSGFLKGLAKKIGKATGWFIDKGWQTVLTVSEALLGGKSRYTEHLQYQLTDTMAPPGTILFQMPITPAFFTDTNLNTRAESYNYFAFIDSFFEAQGSTASINATGQFGMFICTNPNYEIQSATGDEIVRLVSDLQGVTCNLDKKTQLHIPVPKEWLSVDFNTALDPELAYQGHLYFVTMTEIDLTTAAMRVVMKYSCAEADDRNTLLRPVGNVADMMMLQAAGGNTFSAGPAQMNFYLEPADITIQCGTWNVPTVGGSLLFPAGTYRFDVVLDISGTASAAQTLSQGTVQLFFNGDSSSGVPSNVDCSFPNTVFSGTGNQMSVMFFSCDTLTVPFTVMAQANFYSTGSTTLTYLWNVEVTPCVTYTTFQDSGVQPYLLLKHHPVLDPKIQKTLKGSKLRGNVRFLQQRKEFRDKRSALAQRTKPEPTSSTGSGIAPSPQMAAQAARLRDACIKQHHDLGLPLPESLRPLEGGGFVVPGMVWSPIIPNQPRAVGRRLSLSTLSDVDCANNNATSDVSE